MKGYRKLTGPFSCLQTIKAAVDLVKILSPANRIKVSCFEVPKLNLLISSFAFAD